jgi:hypothetical protein
MKIRLVVYGADGLYYATRVAPENMPQFSPPGIIFEITENVDPAASARSIRSLEQRAKEEARKRGIAHVANLD